MTDTVADFRKQTGYHYIFPKAFCNGYVWISLVALKFFLQLENQRASRNGFDTISGRFIIMNFGHGYLDILAILNIKGHSGLTVKMEVHGEEGLDLTPVNKVDSCRGGYAGRALGFLFFLF